MPVQLVCNCGKQLTIPDAHAGRRIACPVCGQTHQVPDVISAERPNEVQSVRPGGGSGKGRLVALVVLLVLLLGGTTAAWWLWIHKGQTPAGSEKEGDDLALIPANAQGFISVRLADLWKSPAMEKAIADARERDPQMEDLAEKMDRETGLRPSEVERLNLVSIDLDQKLAWLVLRTRQPYDRRKVLSRLSDARSLVHQGQSYYLGHGADGRLLAVHFAGTHVLMAGSEKAVKHCLDFAAGEPVKGPLQPVITLARGTHTAVAGVSPSGAVLERLKGVDNLKSLGEMKVITATIDISEKATVETKTEVPSEEEAKKLQATLKKALALVKVGLLFAPGQLLGENLAQHAPAILELLTPLKFAHKGKEVTANAEIEDGSKVAGMLLALPKMIQR
jgi:hypothetical protein